ncbi:hypothetical protein NPIL_253741 [Nephila pilipes]|uniref:Uncharacterized protein n=1 Tax=Nephila pilipes TaxID=299642 RepID=A0A8X6MWI6_NEPPI|nr:hypothetical protein NPIL_253741 [Nephila pilipes]
MRSWRRTGSHCCPPTWSHHSRSSVQWERVEAATARRKHQIQDEGVSGCWLPQAGQEACPVQLLFEGERFSWGVLPQVDRNTLINGYGTIGPFGGVEKIKGELVRIGAEEGSVLVWMVSGPIESRWRWVLRKS